ncbi:ABC transporter permease [Salinisphaera hydrothermalis]|uniref:ABC transporter permease n=1 Tax=Salinisphaera hydrothermalis TaxID=563188 RepID=UPI003342803C
MTAQPVTHPDHPDMAKSRAGSPAASNHEAVPRRRSMQAMIFQLLNSSLVAAALIALFVTFTIISPFFLTESNMLTLLNSIAVIAVLSIGQTFVIVTAGIDLSQGSVVGLSGIIGAQVMTATGSITLGVIAAIASGVAVGLFNGVLTAFTRVPAFIATLGTLSIAGGGALLLTGGQPIYQLPAAFNDFGTAAIGILPYIMIVSIVLAVIAQVVLSRTRFGRSVFAIGSNPRAALLSGLPVRMNTVIVFVISGALSAVGGVLLTAYVNSALPTSGADYELDSIAAVVIGGGSLFGGQGAVWASILGVLLLGVLSNGAELVGVSSYAQTVILGCVVIVAVFIDSFRKRAAI